MQKLVPAYVQLLEQLKALDVPEARLICSPLCLHAVPHTKPDSLQDCLTWHPTRQPSWCGGLRVACSLLWSHAQRSQALPLAPVLS